MQLLAENGLCAVTFECGLRAILVDCSLRDDTG